MKFDKEQRSSNVFLWASHFARRRIHTFNAAHPSSPQTKSLDNSRYFDAHIYFFFSSQQVLRLLSLVDQGAFEVDDASKSLVVFDRLSLASALKRKSQSCFDVMRISQSRLTWPRESSSVAKSLSDSRSAVPSIGSPEFFFRKGYSTVRAQLSDALSQNSVSVLISLRRPEIPL